MKKAIITEIIIFLYVVLLLYAAGTKLLEYNKFVSQMGKSPILTDFASWLAWLVPVIEILVAIMLIIPRLRLTGMYLGFALMFIFTLYITAILSFSKELPCSCGGILSMLGWKEHLAFNILFVLLGLYGIVLLNTTKEMSNKQLAI